MFQVRSWIAAGLASAFLASAAMAQGAPPTIPPWSENWDSYTAGTDPTNPSVGGWENWDLTLASGALVSTTHAHSGANALKNGGNSDVVQKYSTAPGQWVYTAWIYVPYQNATDPDAVTIDTWFILLNTFSHGAATPKNWSLQLQFDPRIVPPTVAYGFHQAPNAGVITTFQTDKWIEIRVEIDLVRRHVHGVPRRGPVRVDLPVDQRRERRRSPGHPGRRPVVEPPEHRHEPERRSVLRRPLARAGRDPRPRLLHGQDRPRVRHAPISASGTSSATATSGFNDQCLAGRSCRNGVLIYGTPRSRRSRSTAASASRPCAAPPRSTRAERRATTATACSRSTSTPSGRDVGQRWLHAQHRSADEPGRLPRRRHGGLRPDVGPRLGRDGLARQRRHHLGHRPVIS